VEFCFLSLVQNDSIPLKNFEFTILLPWICQDGTINCRKLKNTTLGYPPMVQHWYQTSSELIQQFSSWNIKMVRQNWSAYMLSFCAKNEKYPVR
jgi:hypothetical protein